MDQANELRNKIKLRKKIEFEKNIDSFKRNAKIIAMSSNKDNILETNLVFNISIGLMKNKKKVLVIDLESQLSMAYKAMYTLKDILLKKINIKDIVCDDINSIKYVTSGFDNKDIKNIDNQKIMYIAEIFSKLQSEFDFIIIYIGNKITKKILSFVCSFKDIVIVTTCEPDVITSVYATIKRITENSKIKHNFNIIVNKATDDEAMLVFEKLNRVSIKFLNIKLFNLGHIPDDICLPNTIKNRKSAFLTHPNSGFSKAISKISEKLSQINNIESIDSSKSFFMYLKNLAYMLKD